MTARRGLVIGLAGGVALMGVSGRVPAQSVDRVWLIGIVPGGPMPPRLFQWNAFRQRMLELGYAEGRNVRYEVRAPAVEGGAFDGLVADLVNAKVDVIVATGNAAIAAARRASQQIPIVMCPTNDPVGAGLFASLARPGGNLTGISIQTSDTAGKQLQLLREWFPKLSRVAFLMNTPVDSKQVDAAQAVALGAGIQLQTLEVAAAADALPGALAAAVKARAEALWVAQTTFTFGNRAQITALALQNRLPSMYALAANADAGGLMGYGPNDTGFYKQAAGFVDKILKGARPADMPVQQPIAFDLVINRKTAKALGLTVPQILLLQVDRMIE